jgi:nucleoside-diphosphate-sugar epimerase
MNIIITGGAGFLGARLARALLAQGDISVGGDTPRPITRLALWDRAAPPADLAADPRVAALTGDLNLLLEQKSPQALADIRGAAIIFHLAAAVSAECEADFDLGLRSNLDATMALLSASRAAGHLPVLVSASSLAVFGQTPLLPFPPVITDYTLPTPQTSYGAQKAMCELLVADYSRKGYLRGRSVRPMTVSVRPGKPNGAASGFFSGMVREPLAGVRSTIPVSPDTLVALASPASTVAGLIRAATASDAEWGPSTAINLPALCTSVRDMAAALEKVADPAATALLDWVPDPVIARIVATWPGVVEGERAQRLGLVADADFESVIRAYIADNPQAVRLPFAG